MHSGMRCRTYPAHLHINVDKPWRGRGIGLLLMQACLDQLRTLRVSGVHLHTTNMNQAACRLYEALGFQLLAARTTGLWSRWVGSPVENRCYGLTLTAQGPLGISMEDLRDGAAHQR